MRDKVSECLDNEDVLRRRFREIADTEFARAMRTGADTAKIVRRFDQIIHEQSV